MQHDTSPRGMVHRLLSRFASFSARPALRRLTSAQGWVSLRRRARTAVSGLPAPWPGVFRIVGGHTTTVARLVSRGVRSALALQRRRPVLFLLLTLPGLLLVLQSRQLSPTDSVSFSRGLPAGLHREGRTSESRYVHWMTGNTGADREYARDLGCRSGEREVAGPVVLAFGRQVDAGGTRGFDGPSVLRSYELIAAVSSAFAAGLAECSDRTHLLVVATSNYHLDDPATAARFGTQWAAMLDLIEPADDVTVLGGTDLEPGWGAYPAAAAWVESFRAAGKVLVSNASADGCPRAGLGGRCANGWTVDGLAGLVWGGDGLALPQIYRHDGVQAEQWGVLARSWDAAGGAVRFAGAMTQVRACEQVRNRNCPQLSLDPEGARRQLSEAVGELAAVPVGTDVGWG
jgi:hypothetical protein